MQETAIFALIAQPIDNADDLLHRKAQLAALLNELILHDFNALIQLLYRVDVSEKKVKQLLQQQPSTDAGKILAELLIDREREKALLRQLLQNDTNDIPEQDRW